MKLILVRNLSVGQVLKEPFIFVLSDLPLISVPNCLKTIDRLSIKLDRVCDKERVFPKDLLNFNFSSEISAFRL